MADGSPLVFPVGHYLGPFHAERNAPALHHVVRVGLGTPKIPDEEHLDVWALAHGVPSRLGDGPWTRDAVLAAAREAGMTEAEPILAELVRRGVVVEVSADGVTEFARGHRVQSLLAGLPTPQSPLVGIGLGVVPVVLVEPRVFEVWQWGHLWPSVWAACEGFASVAVDGGSQDPAETDPVAVLDTMLPALRTLVAHSAAYLDVVA